MQKECLRSTFLDRISYTLKYSQDPFTGQAVSSWAFWPGLGCGPGLRLEPLLEALSREEDM